MKNYLHFQQRVLMIITFILAVNITASFSQARVQDDTVKAMQVTILPVINGVGDDDCWLNTTWQSIGQTWIPYGESVDIGDYSGKYKVAWSATENILYFLVEITDDKFVDGYVYDSIPGIGGGYYNDDILEVFLDEDRSGGLHIYDDAENAFSYHIVINAPADGNTTYQCVVCDIAGPSVADSWYPDYASHFPQFTVKKTGNQYVWEFSLAVYDDTYNHNNPEASRVQLQEGKVMGLSLAYCDNDDPDENPKKRDNFFGSVWVPESAKNDHWKDADGYGTIMLISDVTHVKKGFINPPLYDVCVIGGGSGGFGAALAAARAGAKVILVEKQPIVGGTSTSAFVTNWEPGPGCSFPREIYNRLKSNPGSVGIGSKVHSYERNEPYGINIGTIRKGLTYDSTLRRAGIPANKRYSVVMKTEALAQTMESMLKEAGVEILLNTTFIKAETKDGIVLKAHLAGADNKHITIRAGVFIDATGGAFLCRDIGCETMLGSDSRERFNEPSAPQKADSFLNAISLCYRIRKVENPKRQQKPSGPVGDFGKVAFATGVNDKELIINPLPLIVGTTLIDKGYRETMLLARKYMLAHWCWLQEYPHFKSYELKDIAPMLGIRESYRVLTEYILTEHDVRTGLKKQQHDDIVAIADHALDVHGGSSGIKELKEHYGIPYRCLIPRDWKNLLVACRGAGFSHIAASSCRLSRTMIAIGHAAGIAAAEAAHEKKDVRDINIPQLVHEMGVMKGETQDKENYRGGLVLNEDNTNFLAWRTEDEMTVEGLKELVDHYAKGTQVRQLMFSPNSMCVSYASEVWDPVWHGYDDPEALKKAGIRGSPVKGLLLNKRGIDPYAVWIEYSRELGVSPWMSMRMNDVHNVDDPNSRAHSSFWKENPQFRRVTHRFDEWTDRAFDYGHKAVRDYHMALIRELFERYDFDGLELDWMRFGYHFRPGYEEEGVILLTEFMTEVRRLADEHAIRRGHPIKIGVRVPSRPWTAKGLGMDAITWAKRGLIDMLVVTPFWATIETDMPIEKWKELLGDSPVVLAAGLEVLLRPYPAANVDSIGNFFLNNAETVRGAAASLLHRGADRIYLFNYMISGTTPGNEEDFYKVFREAGSLKTATAHPRRHVVTYSDTWAPGEREVYALPVFCSQNQTAAFQIHIGPRPKTGDVRVFIGLGEEGNCDTTPLKVRVNGELCAASKSAPPTHMHPVVKTMAGFDVLLSAVKDGYNSVEVVSSATGAGKIVWVEIFIIP